jgi:hypothetical protein
MRSPARKVQRPRFLSGWKDIASYLGKGVRTVQRYEREFALPVRRPAGKSTGSVVATTAELDAWVSASPIREAFRLTMTAPNSTAATKDISTGIAEMRKLREQMADLRSELRSSLELLKASIHGVHDGLQDIQWRKRNSPSVAMDIDSRTRRALELLPLDNGGRKAS